MVKMKEFTPTGGEESVKSMAENNGGGHKCVVVKDGDSGNPVLKEITKRVIDSIDAMNQQRDDAFERMERRGTESFERMERRCL